MRRVPPDLVLINAESLFELQTVVRRVPQNVFIQYLDVDLSLQQCYAFPKSNVNEVDGLVQSNSTRKQFILKSFIDKTG
jgi:hypothetical protein